MARWSATFPGERPKRSESAVGMHWFVEGVQDLRARTADQVSQRRLGIALITEPHCSDPPRRVAECRGRAIRIEDDGDTRPDEGRRDEQEAGPT